MIPAIRIDPSGAYALAAVVTEQHLVPEVKTDLLGNAVHGEQAPATPWKAIYVQEGINKSQTILVKGNNTYVGPGDEYTIVAGYPSLDPLDTECSISYEHGIIFFCNTVDTVDTEFEIEYIPIGTVVDTHPVLDTVRVGEPAQAEAIGEFSASQGYTTKAYGAGASANGNAAIASGNYSTAEGSAIAGYAPQACSVDGAGVVTIVGVDATEEFANGENVLVFALDGTPLSETGTIATDPVFAANTTFDLAAPLAYGAATTGYIVSTHKGRYAHAEGNSSTQAIGQYSHASGRGAISRGLDSFAHGVSVEAQGSRSIALSRGKAVGDDSLSANAATTAAGDASSATGEQTTASTDRSSAEGMGCITGFLPVPCTVNGVTVTIAGINVKHQFANGNKVRFFDLSGMSTGIKTATEAINTDPVFGGDTVFDLTNPLDTNILTGYVVDTEISENAHAEGDFSVATGKQAHAENQSSAHGQSSHAEGTSTAYGAKSHARNTAAYAYGESSSASGDSSIACHDKTSAEGDSTVAGGESSHAEGYLSRTCYAPIACAFSEPVPGTYQIDIVGDVTHEFSTAIFPTAGDTVLLYAITGGTDIINYVVATIITDPVFGATTSFEIDQSLGDNTSAYIVDISFGWYSHAEGVQTAATGQAAHSEGYGTSAIGDASHVEGADGRTYAANRAIGDASHAEGGGNMVVGQYGHGENRDNLVIAEYAHAEGDGNSANSEASHVEGTGTTTGFAARGCAVAIPNPLTPWVCDITIAAVDCTGEFTDGDVARFYFISGAHAITETKTGIVSALAFGGVDTTFTLTLIGGTGTIDNLAGGYVVDTEKGMYAHAEGEGSRASGTGAHSEGKTTIASGLYSHAQNREATASGAYSHAEGFQNTASGQSSHAEGQGTTASGINAHTEGQDTSAGGVGSHAEGDGCSASGDISHAEGEYTIASGTASHAEGSGTNTNSKAYAHAEGVFSGNRFSSSHVSASGRFAATGDAQYERVVIYTSTSALTTTKMRIGNSTELMLPESSLFRFTAEIVAVNTANGLGCAYHVTGLVGRVGAAAANLPTPAVVVTEYEDAALAGCDVTVTVAGNNLEINAVGIAATTIRWVGSVHFTEVIYA